MNEYELYCFNNRKNKECSEYLMQENKKLVYHIIGKYYNDSGYLEYSDFVSNGLFGLYKAIMTFDTNKGAKFSTYAAICIDNEIKMMLRRLRKHQIVVSTNTVLSRDNEGHLLQYEDILQDMKAEVNFNMIIIRDAIKDIELTELEKRVVSLRMKNKTQQEISDILGFSQSYISRILKRAQNKFEKALYNE
nr:MAG TPA: DNA directed RNA polymerase subunit [Caudoviricetes sp.]